MNFVSAYAAALELKRPYRIVLKSKAHKKMEAAYWGMYRKKTLVYHLIHVYMGCATRDLDTLIAHELIHAWQEENGIDEVHGPEFIKMAKKMESVFGLEGVYIPGTDI